MPRLRRRQLRIPNIRFIGQSRAKKNNRNSSSHSREDAAAAHRPSDDQSHISGSTTPQNELNLEDNPLYTEEVVNDVSHQWTDAVKEHYLKNMNSMAPTTTTNQDTDEESGGAQPLLSNNTMNSKMAMSNQRNGTTDADDDTTATPIRSNRHPHEPLKATSSRHQRNFRRRSMPIPNQRAARANDADDDTNCTPLISNCHEDERSDVTSSISLSNISNATPIMSNCHSTYGSHGG